MLTGCSSKVSKAWLSLSSSSLKFPPKKIDLFLNVSTCSSLTKNSFLFPLPSYPIKRKLYEEISNSAPCWCALHFEVLIRFGQAWHKLVHSKFSIPIIFPWKSASPNAKFAGIFGKEAISLEPNFSIIVYFPTFWRNSSFPPSASPFLFSWNLSIKFLKRQKSPTWTWLIRGL